MTTDLLAVAEDELARLRGLVAQVAAWINNPAHDPAAREALARQIGLPEPRRKEAA
ncbi:hypothetical protein ACWGH4_00045 [Streptomyces sp. NPDC054847]